MAKVNQNKLFADHLAIATKDGVKMRRTKAIEAFIKKHKGDENVNPKSLDELDLDNPTKEMKEVATEIIKKRTSIHNTELENAIKKIAGVAATKTTEKVAKPKKSTYRAQEY
jgi:hypothetical protein